MDNIGIYIGINKNVQNRKWQVTKVTRQYDCDDVYELNYFCYIESMLSLLQTNQVTF